MRSIVPGSMVQSNVTFSLLPLTFGARTDDWRLDVVYVGTFGIVLTSPLIEHMFNTSGINICIVLFDSYKVGYAYVDYIDEVM